MTRQAMSGCALFVFSVLGTAQAAHHHGAPRHGHGRHLVYAPMFECAASYQGGIVTPAPAAQPFGAATPPPRRPSWVLSDEDPILDPAKGRAALHVDVPWNADIKIEYKKADGRAVSEWTLSRGKYRNFLLEDLPTGRDKLVRVDVHARGRNPDGSSYDHEKVKSVFLLAGDRRYLDFVKDWEAKEELPTPTVMIVALNADAGAPATPAAQPKPTLYFAPTPLAAFVAYDDQGMTAKSLTFSKAGDTPDSLTIVDDDQSPGAPDFSEMDLESLVLQFDWKKKDGSATSLQLPIAINKTDTDFVFKAAADNKSETLKLDFSDKAGSIRAQVEKALAGKLLKTDSPSALTISASIKFKGRKPHKVQGIDVTLK